MTRLWKNLCIFILFTSFSAFSKNEQLFEIDNIKFKLVVDNSNVGEFIKLKVNHSSNNNVVLFLSDFYGEAIKNDVEKLRELYYVDDGSKVRFSEEVKTNPNKYVGFKNLKSVTLGKIYSWGDYNAIEVQWTSVSGETVDWIELVNCRLKCFISDKLYNSNDDFEFFSSLIYLAQRNEVVKQDINGFDEICYDEKCNNPIKLSLSLDRAKKLSFNRNDIKKIKFDNQYFKAIKLLFEKVWKEDLLDKNLKYSELDQLAAAVLSCCIKDSRKRSLFPNLELIENDDNYIRFKKVYLMPVALLQFLSKVDVVNIVASTKIATDNYLFLEFINKDNKKSFEIIALNKVDNKILVAPYPNVSEIQTILMYPKFVEIIYRRLSNK